MSVHLCLLCDGTWTSPSVVRVLVISCFDAGFVLAIVLFVCLERGGGGGGSERVNGFAFCLSLF